MRWQAKGAHVGITGWNHHGSHQMHHECVVSVFELESNFVNEDKHQNRIRYPLVRLV